jgi:hypothetical protein
LDGLELSLELVFVFVLVSGFEFVFVFELSEGGAGTHAGSEGFALQSGRLLELELVFVDWDCPCDWSWDGVWLGLLLLLSLLLLVLPPLPLFEFPLLAGGGLSAPAVLYLMHCIVYISYSIECYSPKDLTAPQIANLSKQK